MFGSVKSRIAGMTCDMQGVKIIEMVIQSFTRKVVAENG